MLELGIIIILGLPNATDASQEIDDLYQTFKPRKYERKNNSDSIKIARQSAARHKQ